jgi:hypothetical protein
MHATNANINVYIDSYPSTSSVLFLGRFTTDTCYIQVPYLVQSRSDSIHVGHSNLFLIFVTHPTELVCDTFVAT